MKRVLALTLASAAAASAFTVECLPMYGNFFAGLPNQPCLRLKVNATAGEKIVSLHFTTGKTSRPADITKATLSKSKLRQFSPNAVASNQPTAIATTTAAAGSMIFNTPIQLNEGANYLWLSYDVASSAKGKNNIGAECIALTDGNGQYVLPEEGKNGSQGVPGKVYEFKYRIAPYHRGGWHKSMNATHFKYATDYIIFGLSQNGGNLAFRDGGNVPQANFETALGKAKSYRGSTGCHIICGFAISENTKNSTDSSASFGDVISNASRRRALAQKMAKYLIDNGFDGIDIDYEYPAQSKNGSWDTFAEFMTDLREELAGTGMSISIALNVHYDPPIPRVYDQADFVHLMSYGLGGRHETMELFQQDINWAVNAKISKVKIVGGLGFFARDTLSPHQDGGGLVYSDVVSQYPNIAANVDTFINKNNNKEYYFNGVTTTKNKCQYIIKQKLGGVIIWAYDGDVAITNARSLSKAMYSVIKATKR